MLDINSKHDYSLEKTAIIATWQYYCYVFLWKHLINVLDKVIGVYNMIGYFFYRGRILDRRKFKKFLEEKPLFDVDEAAYRNKTGVNEVDYEGGYLFSDPSEEISHWRLLQGRRKREKGFFYRLFHNYLQRKLFLFLAV